MKIFEALRWASSFLTEYGFQHQPIAEILLKHYLKIDRSKLFQMMQDELPQDVEQTFKEAIKQVSEGVPVQHITGFEDFYGRKFTVNEHVLIPRPETEELVLGLIQRIDKHFADQQRVSVVDVGTGSGAIAITLALENRKLDVTTVDISLAAINVAKQNAEKLSAAVRFLEGDLLSPVIAEKKTVDVVVSNPPYISEADFELLDDNVRVHEPTLALVGGISGYELYERLVAQIPNVLKKKGIIAFEVGVGQSERVEALIKGEFPHANTEIVYDINGKDRMVFASMI
ncbi:protein-(glutamine-N5) methyltransferase, release factor-specific [Anaerobacillus alkalidiazotrophicus]|uniref:Release factor glutamine methyltransferase n=1 Tax=Anaerobacillus alkalidiazotrophicus TaxID=472963 RepID=A0A1S2MDI8_9BACI|nr:peptide chain release factor N(5)-glutamine methyltransferase [Anaerobacillus alkalidiazotrophicus]OIJ22483.1 protein-(glutamine-N5) methyltransferase, release factor-specific [Anaerobacillus alkalidiazotrophicus]